MNNETIEIDTSSFTKFAKDLKRASPELAKSLRKNLKLAGEVVAADARRRSSWSSRIPQAIKVGANRNLIRVYVLKSKAPEAKPLEHGGQQGTFRHPVFGNREVWVSQPARPFLGPAAEAGRPAALLAAKKAVDDALEEVHSHG